MIPPPFTGVYGGRNRPGTGDSTAPYMETGVLSPTSSRTNMRTTASLEIEAMVISPTVDSMPFHRLRIRNPDRNDLLNPGIRVKNHSDSPIGNETSDTVGHTAATDDSAMKPFSQPISVLLEPDRNHQPVYNRPESIPRTKSLFFWGPGKRNLLNGVELPVPTNTRSSQYGHRRALPVDQGRLVSSFKRLDRVPAVEKAVVTSQADKVASWSILKVPGVQCNAQKPRETFEHVHLPNYRLQAFTGAPVAGRTSRAEPQANSPLQVDGRSLCIGSLQLDTPPSGAEMVLESTEIKIKPEDSDTAMSMDSSDSDRTLSVSPGATIFHETVLAKLRNNTLGESDPLFRAAPAGLAKCAHSPSPDPGSSASNKGQRAVVAQITAIPQTKPGLTAGGVYSPLPTRLGAQFSAPSFPMPPSLNNPVSRQALLTPLQSALAASRVPTNLASQAVSQPLTNNPVGAAQTPVQNALTPTRPLGHVHTFGHVNRRKKGKSYWAFSLPHQAIIRGGGGVPPPEYIAPAAVYHNFFSNAPPKNMDLSHITIPMTAKEILTFAPRHTNNHQFQHRMDASGIGGSDQAAMISYQRDLVAPDAPLSNTITRHIMNAKKTAPANPDPRLQTDLSPSWWTFSPHNKEIWDNTAIDYPLTALGSGVNRAKWPVLNDRGPLTMALEHATRNGHHHVLLSGLDTYIAQEGLSKTLPAAALSVRCQRTGRLLTPDQDFKDRHKQVLWDFRLWLRVDAECRGYKWL